MCTERLDVKKKNKEGKITAKSPSALFDCERPSYYVEILKMGFEVSFQGIDLLLGVKNIP